ncbi:MAG: N-acetylmuramoyl-L-alanine amidase family protein [Pleomorphochaeta sp.]
MRNNLFMILKSLINVFINKKYILFILILVAINSNIFSSDFFDYPISTIVIDAGHGGEDSGALASYSFDENILEKDITLKVALEVEKNVKKALSNIRIIQTRDEDKYLSLQTRSEKGYNYVLNDRSSSLYISIHANSAANKDANGIEVFTKLENKVVSLFDETTPIENLDLFVNEDLYTLNQKQYSSSINFASTILDSVISSIPTINNRGVKSEDLYVLNVCRTTACLVEIGFLSNEDEAKLLIDEDYQKKIAKAISDGIVSYIKNRR